MHNGNPGRKEGWKTEGERERVIMEKNANISYETAAPGSIYV